MDFKDYNPKHQQNYKLEFLKYVFRRTYVKYISEGNEDAKGGLIRKFQRTNRNSNVGSF